MFSIRKNRLSNCVLVSLCLFMMLEMTSCKNNPFNNQETTKSNKETASTTAAADGELKKTTPKKAINSGINPQTYSGRTSSTYGYNQLNEAQQLIYSQIVEAFNNCQSSISIKADIPRSELMKIMEIIFHDNPDIFWVNPQYSSQEKSDGSYELKIDYTITSAEVKKLLSQLDAAAAELLSDIPADSSDFDKATLAHDKLINHIEYDKAASHQADAYGAIVGKKAACLGYAKAYQYLLLKMNIETLVVYGNARELHAWNYVELFGQFYFVDVTFDDTKLDDGRTYTSHAYLFLDDEDSAKTHKPLKNGGYLELPQCRSKEENYFIKSKLMVYQKDLEGKYFIDFLKNTAKDALSIGNCEFQIKTASGEVAENLEKKFISNGILDSTISNATVNYKNVQYIGRTFDSETNVYTFMFKPQNM